MSVLVTGATGFLGKKITSDLHGECKAFSRRRPEGFNGDYSFYDLNDNEDYADKLVGVKTIIHCAARVHVMNEKSSDALSEFRKVNTVGTLNLANQAAKAKVKRFIFISSVKVNGECTSNRAKFNCKEKAKPEDPYGISKAEAELGLFEIAKETEMEIVIIRPPLVYGPGVKGNFYSLLKLANKSIPLPFGLVNNQRSMIYLDNLSNLIITCIDHENATNRVFLASDDYDLSLKKLLVLIKSSMNRTAILLPIPLIVYKLLGKLMGKQEVVNRIIGNLQVDSSDAKKYLNWNVPHSVEVGIKATVDDFLENQRRF
jgi:nucleoside-diphosphate-sugar epimerase